MAKTGSARHAVKQAEFARLQGWDRAWVTRLKQAGRLVMTADGLVDVEASRAEIAGSAAGRGDMAAHHAGKRAAKRGGKVSLPDTAPAVTPAAPPPQPERLPEPDAPAGGGFGADGRTRWKMLLLDAENKQIKLEMALRRGLRYPRAALKREAAGLGNMLRAAIERVIDQTAPRLAAQKGEDLRRALLLAELRRVRWMVKSEYPRTLRRLRAAARAGMRTQHEEGGAS